VKERLEKALALDLPYAERMPDPGAAKQDASVLFLISRDEKVLLTRRTEDVLSHKGQIAFPGGRKDPGDRDWVETALREAEEEVGLRREGVEVIGSLPPLWVFVSRHLVVPVVALHSKASHELSLEPHAGEISETFWVPFEFFLDDKNRVSELRQYEGRSYVSHVYLWEGRRIWGATAFMLKNLADRFLRASGS
jgi:8-oxo-dGTP pyrophosphatase MutT (NUDIX family)